MELLADTWAWFVAPERWDGPDGIPARTAQHLWLSLASTGLAALLALPVALWLAHHRRGQFLAGAVVNLGRAIPSFGVIVLLAVLFITTGRDVAFWPLVIAMVLLSLPPIFANAYAGVAGVDDALVDAARGMGFTERQLLLRVELPVALPILLAGVRIAFVQVVATVALGAVVTGRTGGLGAYIVNGFARLRSGGDVVVLGGAVLVALLTLASERLFTLAERRLVPPGLRPAHAPRPPA